MTGAPSHSHLRRRSLLLILLSFLFAGYLLAIFTDPLGIIPRLTRAEQEFRRARGLVRDGPAARRCFWNGGVAICDDSEYFPNP